MSNGNGRRKAMEKNKGKKTEKTPVVIFPGVLPLFPIGMFLLPLIIPIFPPAKQPKK
jgi:hypothetical protein